MAAYSETLQDHFESPRNEGTLEPPCVVGEASLFGRAPQMRLYLRIEGGRIQRTTFQATGCGVAVACCSALTEMVTGRAPDECAAISPQMIEAALVGLPIEKRFCAHLAIEALRDALRKTISQAVAGVSVAEEG